MLREARPWSATVIALLRHLELVGFPASPRVVGEGFDQDGREVLGFIEGDRADRASLSDEGIHEFGALLRDLHRATASFRPPDPAIWMPWWGRELRDDTRVIGHGDAVPWNVIVRAGRPVGLIDWDTAGPIGPRWELGHAVWLHARLYGEDATSAGKLPDVAARLQRLRLMVEGYGLGADARRNLVDTMIEFAVRSAAQETIDSGVARSALKPAPMAAIGGGAPLTGHELLWAVTWRIRSAAWILEHRRLIEAALA